MSYAPIKPDIEPPTLEEAQRIVDELDRKWFEGVLKKHKAKEKRHNTKLPLLNKPLERKVIAYSLRGSVNYGLNHPDSDRDLFIITTNEHRKIQQGEVFGEDSMVMGLRNFQLEMEKGHYQLVDIIRSPLLNVIPEYRALFSAFRFSDYKYMDSAFKTGKDFLVGSIDRKFDHPRRAKKYLQTTLVASFMINKVQQFGTANYVPVMDGEERELFFEALETLWERTLAGATVQELLEGMGEYAGIDMVDHPLSKEN